MTQFDFISVPPPVPSEQKPRVWPVIIIVPGVMSLAVMVTVVLMLAAMCVANGVQVFGSPDRLRLSMEAITLHPAFFLSTAAMGQALILAGALIPAWLSPVSIRDRLRLGPSKASAGSIAVMVIGVLGLSQLSSLTIEFMGFEPTGTLRAIMEVVQRMSPLGLVGAVVVIGVLPGLGEEMLCRGYVQTRLAQRWGPGIAISISAVIFGIMHMDPMQGPYAVGLGLLLGLIVERTGSIRPAMICHGINNSLSIITGWFLAGVETELWFDVLQAIVCAAAIAGSVVYVLWKFPGERMKLLPAGEVGREIPAE